MRLNRFIALSGVCARREADKLIAAGKIKINGNVVSELGTKVIPVDDKVTYKGEALRIRKFVYLLLNKPKNTITTTSDPSGRRTVMDFIKNATDQRVYPVGRLDRNTTGLLLLTNDGELAEKITHPSYKIRKIYHVQLERPMEEEDMQKLLEGVTLEDGPVLVNKIDYVTGKGREEVGVEIHVGRNRIVRRMFEHLGYKVERLDRVSIGSLTKKNLSRGDWRELNEKEVGFLKML